jgi:hypothetical protein
LVWKYSVTAVYAMHKRTKSQLLDWVQAFQNITLEYKHVHKGRDGMKRKSKKERMKDGKEHLLQYEMKTGVFKQPECRGSPTYIASAPT